MAKAAVRILSGEHFEKLATLETNKDGVADFTFNTDSWTDIVSLAVSYYYKHANFNGAFFQVYTKILQAYYQHFNCVFKLQAFLF